VPQRTECVQCEGTLILDADAAGRGDCLCMAAEAGCIVVYTCADNPMYPASCSVRLSPSLTDGLLRVDHSSMVSTLPQAHTQLRRLTDLYRSLPRSVHIGLYMRVDRISDWIGFFAV